MLLIVIQSLITIHVEYWKHSNSNTYKLTFIIELAYGTDNHNKYKSF